MAKDAIFCRVLEAQYTSYRSLITTLLALIPGAWRLVMSQLKYYEKFALDVVDIALTRLENEILLALQLKLNTDQESALGSKMAFCRAAYACTAFLETVVPSSNSTLKGGKPSDDPSWVKASVPESVRNQLRVNSGESSYEVFERYFCKLSLRSILDAFRLDWLSNLEDELDALLATLNSFVLDEIISKYYDLLSGLTDPVWDRNIFDWLKIMDEFANCTFETCNYAATVKNFGEEMNDKANLEPQGSSWVIKTDTYINGLYFRESQLRARLDRLRAELRRDYSAGGSNVPLSNIMK